MESLISSNEAFSLIEIWSYFDIIGNQQTDCIIAQEKLVNKLLPELESTYQAIENTHSNSINYSDPELKKTFYIAPYIDNIKALLDNLPVHPKAPQNYLEVISETTNTYCTLNEELRGIEITARNVEDLNDAYSRWEVIQTNFISRQKTHGIYCFHYPYHFDSYALSFCDLRHAKGLNFIQKNYDLTNQLDELYAIQVESVKEGNRGAMKAGEYNLFYMKNGLEQALDRVKGFCGEIRLKAKLGKLLWKEVNHEVLARKWDYKDIKTTAVNKLHVRPYFTSYSTRNLASIENIFKLLPLTTGHSSCFEFHGESRTSVRHLMKPTILCTSGNNVKLEKVVYLDHNVCQINWSSLERAFDFEISLNIQELGKVSAKPYNLFLKNMSYRPDTRQISFVNINNLLHIKHVLYKQTKRVKNKGFILEITRTEVADMGIESTDRLLAQWGGDQTQVWYDMELIYSAHDIIFGANLHLGVGLQADWTNGMVLGPNGEFIINMISMLLQLNEHINSAI
ncbi:hypothetical protein K501DRAFT_330436 [Backusella circina FSU 941]|nr:hypothetical protein K501DRAFT_330436 [Backusella circina FSU 941]